MQIYLYDGTFDGLLTCVFESYEKKQMPTHVDILDGFQQRLDADYCMIVTDATKAKRVNAGLKKNGLLTHVYYVFLSGDEKRHIHLFGYIHLSFRMGAAVSQCLTETCVYEVSRLYKNVWREAHSFKEFIRFSELQTGVLYCQIEPKSNVLEILVNHFMDRLPSERFVIHDLNREIAAFYEKGQYVITELKGTAELTLAAEELYYQGLWKVFHQTIAIEERINKKLQQGNMPKRFWKHMLEMQEG